MNQEELMAVLRLQKTKSIGHILAKKLILAVGSAEGIFSEKKSNLLKINGLGSTHLKNLFNRESLSLAEKEVQLINSQNIRFRYFLNENYPKNLQQCIDAPILFFEDGQIDFSNPNIISVVGTRKMTRYGKQVCEDLIENLKPYNPIIVSGFAYGVDICAHQSAIKNNLQTIGVLAHGFGQIYPKSHKKHMRDVMNNGGFITEFFYDEQPLREHFLQRNRIVAGLSKATIVIESAEKGGALVTADIANSYDREVMAVPGKTSDLFSKGCNRLIQQNKAHLIQNANDVITLLNWDVKEKKPAVKQAALFVELTEKEQLIFDYLKSHQKELLDVIAMDVNIPTYQLSTLLLQLELKGLVNPLPGKQYEVVL